MPRKDHEDEEWESEAQGLMSAVAHNEFARFKLDLKKKAGLLPISLWTRVKNRLWGILERLIGLWSK